MGFIIFLFGFVAPCVLTPVIICAIFKSKAKKSGIKVGDKVYRIAGYDNNAYVVTKMNAYGVCIIQRENSCKKKRINVVCLTKHNFKEAFAEGRKEADALLEELYKNRVVPASTTSSKTTPGKIVIKKTEKFLPFVSCPCCGGKFEEKEIDFSKSIFKCEYCDSIFSFNTK